jgi:zinc/manganese transport system substrate-binding protein
MQISCVCGLSLNCYFFVRRLLSILCFLGLSGAPNLTAAEAAKPLVVSSFTIIENWVQVIGDKQFELVNLVPSHSETHGYQLNARNARDLRRANLIVGMSPTLEPWLEAWAKSNGRETQVLWLFDDRDTGHKGHAHCSDPHAWTNPAEVKKMTLILAKRLGALTTPASTETSYRQYVEDIDRVDEELRHLFSTLPPGRRNLVTQHANLSHFAQSYGLRIARTILTSSSAESADPSARHFSELLALIRREGIRVIVTDAGQSDAFAQRLAEDAGLPAPLALSFEYLEPVGRPGDSWTSMMLLNGRRLHEALSRQ